MDQSDEIHLETDAAEASPTKERDVARPVAAGLPPEEGPEVRIRLARPSLLRGRPFSTIGLGFLPFAISGLLWYFFKDFVFWPHAVITFGALGAICWFTLFAMWLRFTIARSLEITNKRVIERRGLFSRTTDEVLHHHIRNITVKQSFFERLMGIGEIGISSSGQSNIEVDMRDIVDPDSIREIIDQYRPL